MVLPPLDSGHQDRPTMRRAKQQNEQRQPNATGILCANVVLVSSIILSEVVLRHFIEVLGEMELLPGVDEDMAVGGGGHGRMACICKLQAPGSNEGDRRRRRPRPATTFLQGSRPSVLVGKNERMVGSAMTRGTW
uniref:Uncharacterized protein n=1 Tax=Arundo donax TaxID=35708 RepID=A0A0A8ZUD9_ARUDO